jgi:hypothetical protein
MAFGTLSRIERRNDLAAGLARSGELLGAGIGSAGEDLGAGITRDQAEKKARKERQEALALREREREEDRAYGGALAVAQVGGHQPGEREKREALGELADKRSFLGRNQNALWQSLVDTNDVLLDMPYDTELEPVTLGESAPRGDARYGLELDELLGVDADPYALMRGREEPAEPTRGVGLEVPTLGEGMSDADFVEDVLGLRKDVTQAKLTGLSGEDQALADDEARLIAELDAEPMVALGEAVRAGRRADPAKAPQMRTTEDDAFRYYEEFNPSTGRFEVVRQVSKQDEPEAETRSRDYGFKVRKEIYDDWRNESKTFLKTKDGFSNMLSVGKTGPGSMALIFTWMKTLDPDSVVREGEFRSAVLSSGLVSAVNNLANQFKEGTLVEKGKAWQAFLDEAKNLYDSRKREQERINAAAEARARAEGVAGTQEWKEYSGIFTKAVEDPTGVRGGSKVYRVTDPLTGEEARYNLDADGLREARAAGLQLAEVE